MDTTYANSLYSNERPVQVYYSDHLSCNTVHPCEPHDRPAESSNESGEQAGLSLFAQTVLEQEREFYRQFPEAKRAHLEQWGQPPVYQGIYSENHSGLEYYGEGSIRPTVPHYTEPAYVPLAPVQAPSITHVAPQPSVFHRLHYDYVPLSQESSFASMAIAPSPRHAWTEAFGMETGYVEYVAHSRCASPLPYPLTPPSPVLKIEAHRLVPSNHRQLTRSLSDPAPMPVQRRGRGRPRSIGYLSSQTLKDMPPSISTGPSQLISPLAPTITVNNNSVQLTGHWSTDAHAANECLLHAPAPRHAEVPEIIAADHPVATAPSTRRHHITHRLRKSVRAQSHPYTKKESPSTPPSRKSSPSPRKAKSKAAKVKTSSEGPKKPLLACLFCRGRKIACGAPPEGSTDNSCDQCLKRDLECEYPPDSYRGARKKKQEVDLELDTAIMSAAGLDGLDDTDADAEGEDEDEE